MKKDTINVNEKIKGMLQELEKFISTETVVGKPIITNDLTIIPIVDITFGLGIAINDEKNGDFTGGGIGGNVSPNALLIIKGDETKLVNIKNSNNLVELIPQILEKFNIKAE